MTWDVHLWCNQCGHGIEPGGTMIGKVENVDTLRSSLSGKATLETVRNIMREHEVEKHGGKS